MKAKIQLFLIIFTILLGIFFYKYYLVSEPLINELQERKESEVIQKNQNNLIKNLNYNVKLDNNTEYFITSELSELKYKDGFELVNMSNVVAKFRDKSLSEFTITADNAVYNNSNYNTKFSNNVKIIYFDNVITSENLDLDFNLNIVKIYNNVVYEGITGSGKTDNININLITKYVEIFMNNKKNKVELISK